MAIRISRNTVLNAATAIVVAIAAVTLVQDRVLPALAERARLDPGDRIDDAVLFQTLRTRDTIGVTGERPALVVLFKSTCPVCEETAPDWKRLADIAPRSVLAVGLETDTGAAEWVAAKLSGVEAVVPVNAAAFMDRFRIRAVPTTLLFEHGRLELNRVGPLRPQDIARIRRAFREVRGARALRTPIPQARRMM